MKRQTQTTRINGKRVRLVTANGKLTVQAAPVLEIDLQIAAVKAIKKLPGYAASADDVAAGRGKFTIAADQNGSGRRSRNAAVKFKAAGMAAGEPDLRVYLIGGVLRSVEFKGAIGRPTDSQEKRHPLLRALGFEIHTVAAATESDAAAQTVALVRGWLIEAAGANDNEPSAARPETGPTARRR